MAAGDEAEVNFFYANETACYFRDHDKDVDEDGFRFKCVSLKWIRSKNNKFLILNDCSEFQAQNLTTTEQEHHPEHKFNVQVYMNSDKLGPKGVILYVFQDGKKLTVCCNDKLEVHPVEMDVPRNIAEKAHKALFYRTEVSTSCYLLESSLFPSKFLAFEPDVCDHTLSKLTLRHKERDEVDDSCYISMS